MNKVLKTYRHKKSREDIIYYEIIQLESDYCLFFRDSKGCCGWLGFRDSIEEVESMLPSDKEEVK